MGFGLIVIHELDALACKLYFRMHVEKYIVIHVHLLYNNKIYMILFCIE